MVKISPGLCRGICIELYWTLGQRQNHIRHSPGLGAAATVLQRRLQLHRVLNADSGAFQHCFFSGPEPAEGQTGIRGASDVLPFGDGRNSAHKGGVVISGGFNIHCHRHRRNCGGDPASAGAETELQRRGSRKIGLSVFPVREFLGTNYRSLRKELCAL